MFLFVLVLFFLMFCTALPPSRWGLRIWLAAAVPLGTFLLMLPETPPDDLDWAGELFEAMVILAILALFVGVVARWLILGGKETQPPSPPEVRGLRIMDIGLAMLAGYCGGVILTLALALALRGFPGGILLHHGVSVLGCCIGHEGLSMSHLQRHFWFSPTRSISVPTTYQTRYPCAAKPSAPMSHNAFSPETGLPRAKT